MTKLRFFQTYDKYGVDSEDYLQQWDDDMGIWLNVNHVRVAEAEEHVALLDEDEM